MTGNTGTDVVETLCLVFTECSLGSDLSLGRCLGRLVDLLVVYLFVDCVVLFAKQDRNN